ncbi:MAG: hypothetical protein ACKO9V_06510, partial [Candidatus Kapaibacterium sp.]
AITRTYALLRDMEEAAVYLLKAYGLDPSKKNDITAYLRSVLPQQTVDTVLLTLRGLRGPTLLR